MDTIRLDPTRTVLLRQQFSGDFNQRFARLKKKVRAAILREDGLLLNYDPDQPRAPKGDPKGGQWTKSGAAQRYSDKVEELKGNLKNLHPEYEAARARFEELFSGKDFEKIKDDPQFIEARSLYNRLSATKSELLEELRQAENNLNILSQAIDSAELLDVSVKEGVDVDPEVARALISGVNQRPWGDETPWAAARYRYRLVRFDKDSQRYSFEMDARHEPDPMPEGAMEDVPQREGSVYRGMSREEWDNSRKTGKLISLGNHNLDQEGLTFYGSADTAQHYSSGFAPAAYQAAPGRAGVVVEIPRKHVLSHADIPDKIPESEFAHKGSLDIEHVTAVYDIVPVGFRSGTLDVIFEYGQIRSGSRTDPRVTTVVVKQPDVTTNYDPDQERAPKGSPIGGQWVKQTTTSEGYNRVYIDHEFYGKETVGEFLARHKVPINDGKFVAYHGTPPGRDFDELKVGSYIAFDEEHARHFAARDRGLRPEDMEVIRLELTADDIDPGIHPTLRRPYGIKSVTGNRGTFDPNDPIITNADWRVTAFGKWLKTQINLELLPSDEDAESWMERYVEEAYKKGTGRAFDEINPPFLQKPDFYQGTKAEFLRSSFAQRAVVEEVKLLASRVYSDLEGITNAMSGQIRRELAEGVMIGRTPTQIANRIGDRIEKIGMTRALTLVRTEIARAHNEGMLSAMERLGIKEIAVGIEWETTGKPCKLCKPLDGIVMTVKEARGKFPRHPRCLCVPKPVLLSKPTKGQLRTRREITRAIERSFRAEIPKKAKRSVATQRRYSSWRG